MSADDNVAGRLKDKARGLVDGLLGRDDSVADEHPDIEYDPAPQQEIMHGGMVVLSEGQSEQARDGGDAPAESDTGSDSESDTANDTGRA